MHRRVSCTPSSSIRHIGDACDAKLFWKLALLQRSSPAFFLRHTNPYALPVFPSFPFRSSTSPPEVPLIFRSVLSALFAALKSLTLLRMRFPLFLVTVECAGIYFENRACVLKRVGIFGQIYYLSRIYCFLLLKFSYFCFVCYCSGFELNFGGSQMFTPIHAHFGCFSVLGV